MPLTRFRYLRKIGASQTSMAQNKFKRKRVPAPTATAMPCSVEPPITSFVKLPFSDPHWLFEPELGYRALSFFKDGQVRFISVTGVT
jgi:hypothetical protein